MEKKEDRLAFRSMNTDKSKGLRAMLTSTGQHQISEESDDVDRIVLVDIDLIDDLTSFDHPFSKSAKLGLPELAESIKINGVLQNILVRKKTDGRYELLAGHRRTAGARLAGLAQIPAAIKNVNDEQAALIVTDTNLGQRDEILPSERAKAYQLQISVLKAQGKRNDLIREIMNESQKNELNQDAGTIEISTDFNLWSNGPQVKSRDIVAQMNQTSAKQVSRFLRLNELDPMLLDLVDDKLISVRAGVEVSYLRKTEQEHLGLILQRKKSGLSIGQATELRAASRQMELTSAIIDAILFPAPPDKRQEPKMKPSYEKVLKKVTSYCKKLSEEKAEKLAQADPNELKNVIIKAITDYLDKK